MRFLQKLFGSRNDRLLKTYGNAVAQVNALEADVRDLSDADLRSKTLAFRARLGHGVSLEALLPEAFAVVREASRRVLGMRHFDVQVLAGAVLFRGAIAEMRTGEGKTLMAALPAYLRALPGHGVHVVTVNEYLARRDAETLMPLFHFLGMSVGVVLAEQSPEEKRAAYRSDIVYGTNNEFGFDYLRDNMVYRPEHRVQGPLHYAIVDEVDAILIDEARTPLIITGHSEEDLALYQKFNELAAVLTPQTEEPTPRNPSPPGDYFVDGKTHAVLLSEAGSLRFEDWLMAEGLLDDGRSPYETQNMHLVHHMNAALRAHALHKEDHQYVVLNDEVLVVDEHTGRLLPGRRWSDGLHQALEAKEGVTVQKENLTLANLTFQNYFRMYATLAGMTGTAETEAYELSQVYGLETVVIPTNQVMIRTDENDRVYLTAPEKWQAVVDDILDCYRRNQPVLVGTDSIEASEQLSGMLSGQGVPHQVLHAKRHAQEADVISQAGLPRTVTIATNMAGRGTDIVLGGNISKKLELLRDQDVAADERAKLKLVMDESWSKLHQQVVAAGGLRVLGTTRHESRRVDNQLRGRSGRQGDPGSSCFYLSMEDPLLAMFGGPQIKALLQRIRPDGDGTPLVHPILVGALRKAQRKTEGMNFEARKQLLSYDDVINDQRHVVYTNRNQVLESHDVHDLITEWRGNTMDRLVSRHIQEGSMQETWDLEGLESELARRFVLVLPVAQTVDDLEWTENEIRKNIVDAAAEGYAQKHGQATQRHWRELERSVILQALDLHWREHLSHLEHLRRMIHLRAYAQKDPKQEYRREAFDLFADLWSKIEDTVTSATMLAPAFTEIPAPDALTEVHAEHARPTLSSAER